MSDPVGRPSSMAVDDAATYGDVANKGTRVAGMAVSGKYPKQGCVRTSVRVKTYIVCFPFCMPTMRCNLSPTPSLQTATTPAKHTRGRFKWRVSIATTFCVCGRTVRTSRACPAMLLLKMCGEEEVWLWVDQEQMSLSLLP
jgi:hypothetical protein